MNLNCKLSFTDEQRNNIKRHLAGKDVKALATRAEICKLVNELLEPYLTPPRLQTKYPPSTFPEDKPEHPDHDAAVAEAWTPYAPSPGATRANPEAGEFCSDDCCRQNAGLLRRVNTLQHWIDTNAK